MQGSLSPGIHAFLGTFGTTCRFVTDPFRFRSSLFKRYTMMMPRRISFSVDSRKNDMCGVVWLVWSTFCPFSVKSDFGQDDKSRRKQEYPLACPACYLDRARWVINIGNHHRLVAEHITSATSIRLGRLYNRDLIASPTHSTGRSLTSLAPSQTQDFRNQRTVNDGRLIRIRRLWFGQEEQSSGIHRPEPSSQSFDQVEDSQLAQGTVQVHGPTRHVVSRRWPAQPEHLSRT